MMIEVMIQIACFITIISIKKLIFHSFNSL